MKVPKGDVLHQFREDVTNKKLPTVSWVVAPENFSDHPGAPWYGAWYISEMMDILTQNPDVWKKTIFILAYDENDGYFDHVPPFVPAHPDQPETGKTSKGIDTRTEFVTQEQENKRKNKGRTGPIGLGFRVPLVIVSPWSRGGFVNSEVFDHTSTLAVSGKFPESQKGPKLIRETNISTWRRTVCGDLSSAVSTLHGETVKLPKSVDKQAFIEGIHKAQFKEVPKNYKRLSEPDIQQCATNPAASLYLPRQEEGVRPSCALPYELHVDGHVTDKQFILTLSAKTDAFGKQAIGAPFQVHHRQKDEVKMRSYTVSAGDQLQDAWPVDQPFQLSVQGPNGFYRAFISGPANPLIQVVCDYERDAKKKYTGNVVVRLKNMDPSRAYSIQLVDNAYQTKKQQISLEKAGTPAAQQAVLLNLKNSHNWYDFSVKVAGFDEFEQQYAGRVETGKASFSDPFMGKISRI